VKRPRTEARGLLNRFLIFLDRPPTNLRPGKRATGLDEPIISSISSVKPIAMLMTESDILPNVSVTFKPKVVKLKVTRSSGEK
jgi:hypothetical protein